MRHKKSHVFIHAANHFAYLTSHVFTYAICDVLRQSRVVDDGYILAVDRGCQGVDNASVHVRGVGDDVQILEHDIGRTRVSDLDEKSKTLKFN